MKLLVVHEPGKITFFFASRYKAHSPVDKNFLALAGFPKDAHSYTFLMQAHDLVCHSSPHDWHTTPFMKLHEYVEENYNDLVSGQSIDLLEIGGMGEKGEVKKDTQKDTPPLTERVEEAQRTIFDYHDDAEKEKLIDYSEPIDPEEDCQEFV